MSDPVPAATVIVLRPSDANFEVLMVRRHRGSRFMADSFVFPGGRVEPSDPSLLHAATREVREEVALVIDEQSLVPIAHWITPSSEPRRYDTYFYVTTMPPGQTAKHDAVETTELLWATPGDVLRRNEAGELKLPPPTICNLRDLSRHSSIEAVLGWARQKTIVAILPKLAPVEDSLAILLPWDRDYVATPGETRAIDASHPIAQGPSRFLLKDGRWWGKIQKI